MGKISNKLAKQPYPYNLVAAIYQDEERSKTTLDEDQVKGLEYALGTLTERERLIILLRYNELFTLEEAGRKFHITRERCRQIEAKSLKKLRHISRLRYIEMGYTNAIASNEILWHKNYLSHDIKTLDLSTRCCLALKRAGIDTVEQFMALTDEKLINIRSIGAKSIAEIHDVQNRIGSESKCQN